MLKFRRRRERSERRLASTEENLERLFDLVREVKRQIRPLERQAAAARSYTGLADELRAVRLYVAGTELRALDAPPRRRGPGPDRAAGHRGAAAGVARPSSTPTPSGPPTRCRPSGSPTWPPPSAGPRGWWSGPGACPGCSASGSGRWPRPSTPPPTPTWSPPWRPKGPAWPSELEAAEAEAADPGPRAGRGGRRPKREAAAELEAHLGGLGGRSRAAAGRGGGHGGPRGSSARWSTPSSETARAGPAHRPAWPPPSAGPASSRARTTSWASGWPRRSRPATSSRPWWPRPRRPTGGPPAGWRRPRRRSARPNRSCHRSTARADALERALDEARGAAGAELLAGVDGVVGTLLDLVEVDAGWEEAFEAAAGAVGGRRGGVGQRAGQGRAVPARARAGPPAPCWPSPELGRAATGPAEPGSAEPTGPRRDRVHPAATSGPRRGPGHLPGWTRCSTPCWPGRAAPWGLVRGHRPGPGPSRPGGGDPRRRPVLVHRLAGAGRRRGGHRRGGRRGPGPGRGGRRWRPTRRPRSAPRPGPRSRRPGRRRPRRCGPTTATRWPTRRPGSARQRVANDLMALAAELEEIRRDHAELDERIARDTTRAAELRAELPRPGGRSGHAAGARMAAARRGAQAHRRADRRGGPARGASGRSARPAWSSGVGC